ncbi:MAG: hypothetical protein HUU20_23745 [Pirellulales bacterium]|nr:hypothetical protein [Pirellulales bacterium]
MNAGTTTTSVSTLGSASPGFLAGAERDWNVSRTTLLVILAVPWLVAFSGVAAALAGKSSYKLLTQEDGIAETAQVVFYTITLLLGLVLTCRLWRTESKAIAVLYLLFCGGLVFLVGEELSWGQRILRWETAESFAAINKQGETNLHNIEGVGATFKWVQMLVGAYGTILPLVLLWSKSLARYRDKLSLLVPHCTLIPYFALLFLWRFYRNVTDPPQEFYFVVSEYNEVLELVLALGFFLFVVFQLRRLKRGELRGT